MVSQGGYTSGGYLVNAAFLLLAACMSDAPPVLVSMSDCSDCTIVSNSCSSCENKKCWSFWFFGKKKDCGHHIHCPHPGPIPGTEHLTFKQRLKNWLCPNHCTVPDSQTCDSDCHTTIVVPVQAEKLIKKKVKDD